MRILLQFPEGLKKEALAYAQKYENEGHEVLLSGASCYGACDLAIEEAMAVDADKIIHFGHAPFIKKKLLIEVEYVEWHIDVDLDKFEKAIKELKFDKIALATTVQHIHQLNEMKKILESHGKKVFVSKGPLAAYPGQVLGCDAGAISSVVKNSDAVVFVGEGHFHPLAIDAVPRRQDVAEGHAIDIDPDKPVFIIHPKSGQIRKINDEIEKLRKRRKGAILKAAYAKTFGIIVSTKPGQFTLPVAEKIKKELTLLGKRSEIIVSNELSPLALNNFISFDCYIVTACPRIADDTEAFGKPVLNLKMYSDLVSILRETKA